MEADETTLPVYWCWKKCEKKERQEYPRHGFGLERGLKRRCEEEVGKHSPRQSKLEKAVPRDGWSITHVASLSSEEVCKVAGAAGIGS